MPCEVSHITTIVELWARREAPQSADLQRALHIARRCCDDPQSPIWVRSMVWRLVETSHRAVGWQIPDGINLVPCRAASASVGHGHALLIEELTGQLDNAEGRVMVLGALGTCRSVLGTWDAVPTLGAVLIPFDIDADDLPSATNFNLHKGVVWAEPGRYRDTLLRHSIEVLFNDRPALVPDPLLVLARTRLSDVLPIGIGSMIFAAAAHQIKSAGSWSDADKLAKTIQSQHGPTELAVRLGIDRWLGLEVGTGRRMAIAIRRAFRPSAA